MLARVASRLDVRWVAVALVALATLPYLPVIGGGFVFDDNVAIAGNQAVTSDFSLVNILDSGFWGGKEVYNSGSYRPFTVLTFVLDYRVGGGAAWPFHLTNIALHGLCVLVVFSVLRRRLGTGTATAIAAVFAAHALHSENIASIVARADVIATAFGLLAWHLYGRRSPAAIAGSIALFTLALLSKEIAIAILGLIVAEEIFRLPHYQAGNRAGLTRRLVNIAGMLAGLGIYIALRMAAINKLASHVVPQSNPLVIDGDPFERLWTAAALLRRTIEAFVLPLNLAPDYSFAEIRPYSDPWSGDVILGLALWVLLPLAALVARRRNPEVTRGLLLFLAAYVPISNLLLLVPTIFAERLLYLPSLGLIMAAVAALRPLWQREHLRGRLVAILGVVVALHTARGTARALDWRTPRALFTAAVQTAPLSTRNWFNLGVAALSDDDAGAALEALDRAIEIYPGQALAHSYRGVALDRLERPKEAHLSMYRATRMDSRCRDCAFNLVNLYIKYGFFDEARSTVDRYEHAGASSADIAKLRGTIDRVAEQARKAGIKPRFPGQARDEAPPSEETRP